jgi:hypothetical protein
VRNYFVLLGLLPFLAPCAHSPTRTAPEQPTHQARLIPFDWTDGDKLHIRNGWFDTQLGVPCRFGPLDDKVQRCIPATPFKVTLAYFSDAACTQPALEAGCNLEASRFGGAQNWVYASGSTGWQIFTLKDSLPPNSPRYYKSGPDGRCNQTNPFKSGYSYGGTPVPGARFVAATVSTAPGSSRLLPRVLIADDGSRELVGIFDQRLGKDCSPVEASDGVWRCLPLGSDTMMYSLFSDASCTQTLLTTNGPDKTYAWANSGLGCGGPIRVLSLGAPVRPSQVWKRNGWDGCKSEPVHPNQGYFLPGDEVRPTTFAALSVDTLGSGRIVEKVLRGDDGAILMRGFGWHDTRLDADVYLQPLDGTRDLLMPPSTGTWQFADAACSQPAAVTPDGCGRTYDYVTAGDPDGCLAQIFTVGPAARARYFVSNSVCTQNPVAYANLHAVGAPVDPGLFVTVTSSPRR